MKKVDAIEKTCPCGRIITDPNNKTGLCPKCEKKAGMGVAAVGAVGLGVVLKKYGGKIIKGIAGLFKK